MADPAAQLTERLLRDAGVVEGMRVLDVGCGHGDVALMLARIVGPAGQVVAVDRDPWPLDIGRKRAHEAGLRNVVFEPGDLLPGSGGDGGTEPFDAVAGRRVLMYQRDRVAAVERLSGALRPGGLLVFQEHDSTIGPGLRRAMPLHEQVHGWIWGTVEREGAHLHTGFDLHEVLTRAGLVVERVRAEATVHIPGSRNPVADIVMLMMPRLVGHGVATEDEIDIDTLEDRLAEERATTGATFIWDMAFGTWARKPG